jgi:hypothetical protein
MTETNKKHLLFLIRKLQERAEEASTLAKTFSDPEARRMMSEVAELYEKLAQRMRLEL